MLRVQVCCLAEAILQILSNCKLARQLFQRAKKHKENKDYGALVSHFETLYEQNLEG